MLPWFVVGIYGSQYAIDIAAPFDTRLEDRQQLFLAPTIVAFCQSILDAMVRNELQTIIILL